jgi:hypothetical protein
MVLGASLAGAAKPQEDSPATENTPTSKMTNNFFFIVAPPFFWF